MRPGSTIRVAAGSDGHILRVGLEQYVAGVVAGETSALWPDEALRAQAVAAHSYAVHRLRYPRARRYDVTASTLDQCFRDGPVPDRLLDQVSRTAGEYLTGATTRKRHTPLRSRSDPVILRSAKTDFMLEALARELKS